MIKINPVQCHHEQENVNCHQCDAIANPVFLLQIMERHDPSLHLLRATGTSV
jgi:hypothetical protein